MSQAAQMLLFQISIPRTLRLGTEPRTQQDLRRALSDAGCSTSIWATAILARLPFVTAFGEIIEVRLLVFTTEALTGKSEGASVEEVFEGAARLGLKECPPEVAWRLRLECLDQPPGDEFYIGMNPVEDSGGSLLIFSISSNEGGVCLSARDGHPDSRSLPHDLWIFIDPQRSCIDVFRARIFQNECGLFYI